MRVRLFISLLIAGIVPVTGLAEPANVRTPSPVIYLADNLDEADGLGWCIDTVGRGFSDRLHAHSCKPQGGDVRFRFLAETGQIQSVAFEEKCVEVEGTDVMRLFDCADKDTQRFQYDPVDMRFRRLSDPSQCLTAGADSRSAGPFMSRDLTIAQCDDEETHFQAWIVIP